MVLNSLFLFALALTGVVSMTLPVEKVMQETDDLLVVGQSDVLLQNEIAPYAFENCTTLLADLQWWTDRVCPIVRGRVDPGCMQGKDVYIPYYEQLYQERCASPSATPSSSPDASFNDNQCKCIEFVNRKPNVVVFEDFDGSSDSQGAMMIGGNANIRPGFSIGMVTNASTTDMLFVGGDLNFPTGSVVGNIHYGGEATLGSSIRNSKSQVHNDSPVDFGAAQTYFEQLSASLCTRSPTGSVIVEDRILKILRGNTAVEVINVDATSLSGIRNVDLSGVSASAGVVMNVFGNPVNFNVHQTVVSDRHVVWNFCDATEISIAKCEVSGSILAPFAHVTGSGSVVKGQFVAKSYVGTTQFNDNTCLACIAY